MNTPDELDLHDVRDLEELGRRAVEGYAAVLPAEAGILRRGRERRRRRLAAGAAGSLGVVVAAAWGVPHLVSPAPADVEIAVGAVTPSPSRSSATSPGRPAPSPRPSSRPSSDPSARPTPGQRGVAGRLVGTTGCPASEGVQWTLLRGKGTVDTAPLVATSRAASGSRLARDYTARPDLPGWLTRAPRTGVSVAATGDVTVVEATPGVDVRDLPAGLTTTGLACRTERWRLRSDPPRGAEAEGVVLTGRNALLFVLGARARGSVLQPVAVGWVEPGAAIWRVRLGPDVAFVVDRGGDGVVVAKAAAGGLEPELLTAWLESAMMPR